jgi:hypothetical protein
MLVTKVKKKKKKRACLEPQFVGHRWLSQAWACIGFRRLSFLRFEWWCRGGGVVVLYSGRA